jgi:predicted HTH transcriptional regulator
MTFSAGRRRIASPFAQRAARHAENVTNTPDISTIPDTDRPEPKAQTSNAPESVEEHTKPSVESNNQDIENDASDEAQEPTSEDASADKPVRGRGRPRPAEVQQRDDRVLAAIVAEPGRTRAQLEEQLSLNANAAYSSIYRLRVAGKIEKRREGGKHTWYAVEA